MEEDFKADTLQRIFNRQKIIFDELKELEDKADYMKLKIAEVTALFIEAQDEINALVKGRNDISQSQDSQ